MRISALAILLIGAIGRVTYSGALIISYNGTTKASVNPSPSQTGFVLGSSAEVHTCSLYGITSVSFFKIAFRGNSCGSAVRDTIKIGNSGDVYAWYYDNTNYITNQCQPYEESPATIHPNSYDESVINGNCTSAKNELAIKDPNGIKQLGFFSYDYQVIIDGGANNFDGCFANIFEPVSILGH